MKKLTSTTSFLFLLLSLTIFLVQSCRPNPKDDIVVGQSKEEFDEADQIFIGDAIETMIADPTQGFNILEKENHQEIYSHLNILIDQISNTAPVQRRTDFDWKISILKDDEETNAFITPGGHLYIYSGLLKYLEGEHELVGLIAHEIAYADSDLLINQLKIEFGSKNLSKVISNDVESDNIISDISHSLKNMVFDESAVMNADDFCAEIICEFVWDGEGLLSILKRGQSAQNTINWLHSKPVTDNRLGSLTSLIHSGSETCGTPDSTYHQRYLEKIINNLP